MNRKHTMALCHPSKKHYAKGLCNTCYYKNKPAAERNKAMRDTQPGLVRGLPSGWGSV